MKTGEDGGGVMCVYVCARDEPREKGPHRSSQCSRKVVNVLYLPYCLGRGDELAIVVIDQRLLLRVQRPYLAQHPRVHPEQLLEAAVPQPRPDVGLGVEAGGVDLGSRDVRVLRELVAGGPRHRVGVGDLEEGRGGCGRLLEVVVLAEGGAVVPLVRGREGRAAWHGGARG